MHQKEQRWLLQLRDENRAWEQFYPMVICIRCATGLDVPLLVLPLT